MPEKSRKIKALIKGTKKIIEQNTLDYAEVRSVYYMVWAWYYTLCESEMKAVLMNLKEAAAINAARNNSELDELGISYDEMYDIFYDNEAYMDASLLYEDGEFVELFVRKRKLDADIVNLSNYKNSEVLKLAKELANKQGADTYSVYENQYKFAKIEYIDSNLGYYICEFVTCVNGDNYTFTFQSSSQFTDWEYEEIDSIMDSIRFAIDSSLKEPKSTSFWDGVIEKAIGGAILGGIASVIAIIANKKKKKENQSDVNSFSENNDL